MAEGGRLCSLHISITNSNSRGEYKEEYKKNIVRGFERGVNEGNFERLVRKYGKE